MAVKVEVVGVGLWEERRPAGGIEIGNTDALGRGNHIFFGGRYGRRIPLVDHVEPVLRHLPFLSF
jgi:hypothetical protein